ncbi:MAG: family 1 glycosylhydrolase [Patescibacteria group bacterium]
MKLNFPKNFLWGASTSAHQVEGNNINDWSEWETKNAGRLAQEADAKYSSWVKNWNKFADLARDPNNYTSGPACDHYHKFAEDFDLVKQLGHNAHRFSIEWSRIEPEPGKFNEQEIKHYSQVITCLREHGIEPLVTLWHWPLPLWVARQGGWTNKKTIAYFTHYVEKVVNSLNQQVKFWITLNEPEAYVHFSYFTGEWPPQKKNLLTYFRVITKLIKAHQQAYQIIKKINPQAQVGIATYNTLFEAYDNKFINRILKILADWLVNFYFLNHIKSYQDFIGLNHYGRNIINYGFNKNENKIVSDMGWELYPKAIYQVLKELVRYGKPIYITENGLADAEDTRRTWYIKEILKYVHQAIQDGVDVRGYLHWSLLDNFEWDKGFWPHFGLIKVDYKTQNRTVRPSALDYAKICKTNSLEI